MLWLCIIATSIWLGLTFFWHGFWRVDQRLKLIPPPLAKNPSVTAIVPARNEQMVIATSVKKLLAQDYGGDFSIIVANDSSTDKTKQILQDLQKSTSGKEAPDLPITGILEKSLINNSRDDKQVDSFYQEREEIAVGADRLSVVDTGDLPSGWAGKMWALHCAIEETQENPPDYYWLTDADIAHQAGVLSSLVAHAQTNRLALVSQMVALRCKTIWEKLLVPAFIFYFTLIYPFRAINDPASSIAGAAGGSILIRADALESIGGIAALKGAIIDDCTLGKLIKKAGHKIWLGFGERSISLRGYDTLAQFWSMVQRSAYTQLRFSPFLLVIAIGGIAVSHVLPALFFCCPALALMAFIYWPTVRFYGLSPFWALTLPLAAVLFGAMTIASAIAYHLGWQNIWRDRDIGQN